METRMNYVKLHIHMIFVISRTKENVKIQKFKIDDRDSEGMELTGGEKMSSISRNSYATLYVSVKYICWVCLRMFHIAFHERP